MPQRARALEIGAVCASVLIGIACAHLSARSITVQLSQGLELPDAVSMPVQVYGTIDDIDTAAHTLTVSPVRSYGQTFSLQVMYDEHTRFMRSEGSSKRAVGPAALATDTRVNVLVMRDTGALKTQYVVVNPSY